MLDIQRLGLLLRTLGRSDVGLRPEQVTPQVRGVPALPPVGRGVHRLVTPELAQPMSRVAPRVANDEAARQDTSTEDTRLPATARNPRPAALDAAPRATQADLVQQEQATSTPLTLSRAAMVLGAVLRNISSAVAPQIRAVPDAPVETSVAPEPDASPGEVVALAPEQQRAPQGFARNELDAHAATVDWKATGALPGRQSPVSLASRYETVPTQQNAQSSVPRTTTPLPTLRARPLMPLAPEVGGASSRLASVLQQSVEFSGVFYESHLAQWADGLRAAARLVREPQAHWDPSVDVIRATATVDAGARGDAPAPVLRHQLEALETARFNWSGELWPGQPGSLTIEEDDGSNAQAGEASPVPRWRTTLELRLERLGTVRATLSLQGAQVAVTMQCGDANIARTLAAATPALRVAVQERGLQLTGLVISDEPLQ